MRLSDYRTVGLSIGFPFISCFKYTREYTNVILKIYHFILPYLCIFEWKFSIKLIKDINCL